MSTWVLTPIPTALDVRELLAGLLGREVTLQMSDTYVGDPTAGASYAVYDDDLGRTRAVAVMDLALSAHIGAAIGLIPVGGAEVAIEERELSQTLKDNLYEVLNVLAATLNAVDAPHVKLTQVVHVGDMPDGQITSDTQAVGRRLDLEVTVPQYGSGRLSIVGLK